MGGYIQRDDRNTRCTGDYSIISPPSWRLRRPTWLMNWMTTSVAIKARDYGDEFDEGSESDTD